MISGVGRKPIYSDARQEGMRNAKKVKQDRLREQTKKVDPDEELIANRQPAKRESAEEILKRQQ